MESGSHSPNIVAYTILNYLCIIEERGPELSNALRPKVFIARDVCFDETGLPFVTKDEEAEMGENRDAVDVVAADFQDDVEGMDDEYEEAENPSGDEPESK